MSLLTSTRSPTCSVFSIDPEGMENTCTTNALSRMVRASAATTRSRQKGRPRRVLFLPASTRAGSTEASGPSGLPRSSWEPGSGAPSEPGRTGSGAISDQPGDGRSASRVFPALLDPGCLAAQVAQVVQLGPADTATGHRLDLLDRGAVHREGA